MPGYLKAAVEAKEKQIVVLQRVFSYSSAYRLFAFIEIVSPSIPCVSEVTKLVPEGLLW